MELDLIVEVRAWNMKYKWMVRYLCHRCVWARRGSQAFEKANNRSVSEDRPRQILEGEDMKNTGPGVIITMHAIKLLFRIYCLLPYTPLGRKNGKPLRLPLELLKGPSLPGFVRIIGHQGVNSVFSQSPLHSVRRSLFPHLAARYRPSTWQSRTLT